ncbi:Uncharacterized protein FKW44_021390 [Caligus rogercresseyi]|uniref:Uncharacterized protein n=1 Tax=Caligus rogercresseyi TaxID=217165 RepID=A0A7T8JV37_CALRO|nr:Uncharacterized protein FKW44_021390 [Caligus rogercresseyi]
MVSGNVMSAFGSRRFWKPEPHRQPLGLRFRLHIEFKAFRLRHSNIAALKAAVNQESAGMDEDFVAKVCQAFRKRLMTIGPPTGGTSNEKV